MKRNMLLLLMVGIALFGKADVSATCRLGSDDAKKASDAPVFSEIDTYLDLNTGKAFRFIYDGLNEKFNRDDLFGLEFYVNTRTKDTFWLEEAVLVNNALLRDGRGTYKVDPMKVKRDGNGFKVINNNRGVKLNANEKAD